MAIKKEANPVRYKDLNSSNLKFMLEKGFLFITIIMLITIGFKPSANDWAQESLANVFTPMSRFFIASMIAYLVSQYFDVWIYSKIRKMA